MTIHYLFGRDFLCEDQDEFGVFMLPEETGTKVGDILVLGCANNRVRCVEVERVGAIHGQHESQDLIKPKTICDFDLNLPAPVPGGAMRNAWEKGVAAFKSGAGISGYPGDRGTAPHKVWLKGYLWEYCSKL